MSGEFEAVIDPSAVVDAGNGDVGNEAVDNPEVDVPNDDVDGTIGESESTDAEVPEADAESAEGEEDEGKEGNKAGKGDDDIDLRKASKEIRDALNKFKESDPANAKFAKMLRSALGHDLAYQESFKTPEEARVVKSQIEAMGGFETLAQQQAIVASIEETDALLEAGDPKIIEKIKTDAPEGFKKLAPFYLDELRKMDGEAYRAAILPHLVSTLSAAGVENVFQSLKESLENGDAEGARKIAGNLVSWFSVQKQDADNSRKSLLNPEREKIQSEWQKLESAKEQSFTSEWQTAYRAHASNAINKAMAPYVKGFNDAQKRDFAAGVINEIGRRFDGDKTFNQQREALLKSKNRDKNRIVQFQGAKLDSIINDVAKTVYANRYGNKPIAAPPKVQKPGEKGTQQAQAPKVGAGSLAAPIKVKQKPAVADRDTSKDPQQLYEIAGKAFMKSGLFKGKWVTWR